MKRKIGVIGAGSWGTTLAKIVGDNGHDTFVWAFELEVVEEINREHKNSRYMPDFMLSPQVSATSDLEKICDVCDFFLFVVPSHVFRSVANQLGNFISGDKIIVHCTKGIEQQTSKRMSEILREETCVRKFGVLCGPNLSRELAQEQPAGTLVASKFDEVVRTAQNVLHNHYFRVYGGNDIVGAEVGGSYKNIVALAAGMADGLKLGDNSKALLLTRGLAEMTRYGSSLGADQITFSGLAGIGDMIATCASPHSRNHQVGERLARGETLEKIQAEMFMVAEGVKTTRAVREDALERNLELPIVEAAHRILYEGIPVEDAIRQLMARKKKREFVGLTT